MFLVIWARRAARRTIWAAPWRSSRRPSAPARQSEWGASYLLHLARAHMQAGDADQACAAVCTAVGVARQLESATLLARIRRLHARLAARWPGLPAVTELTQRLR